jgi:hypothetical protein
VTPVSRTLRAPYNDEVDEKGGVARVFYLERELL